MGATVFSASASRTAFRVMKFRASSSGRIRSMAHITILLSGYSTIPWPPASLSRGIILRTVVSSKMVWTATHSTSLRCEMVGFFKRRQDAKDCGQTLLAHVQHQADLAERVDRAVEQHADVLDLAALPRVLPGVDVGDQLRVRFEHSFDDAKFIGAQRRSGLRYFDDGVGQNRRLHFRRAPTEFNFGVDAVPFAR